MLNQDSDTIIDKEQLHYFNCYCTLVMLLNGKKINYANIFLQTIKNKYLLKCLCVMLAVDSEYEALSYFLQQTPSIVKSKHILKAIKTMRLL